MMDMIVENFEQFFDISQTVSILIYTIMTSLLYVYWLKPFVIRRRASYAAGVIYLVMSLPSVFFDTSAPIFRLVPLLIVVITVLSTWFLDDRRNLIQKVFLGIVFREISFVTTEIFSELGFYERDIVFSFDLFRSSVTAIILEYVIWNIIFYGGSILLLYIAIRILHRTYKTKMEELKWQEFVMLIIPILTVLAVKPIMSSYMRLWMDGIANGSITENIPGDIYRIIFDILSYLSILIIITFYERIKSKQNEDFARREMLNQIEDTKRYVKRIEEMYDDMKSIRHDMGNHMSVIASLSRKGDTAELSKYIKHWQKDFEEFQVDIKTGNAVTDVIISDYSQMAKRDDITFECSFVYPKEHNINPFDVSVVLNNALTNSMEAVKPTDNRYIRVTSVIRDNVYIISIRNTTKEKAIIGEDGLPVSTKPESNHGYGVRNIKSIAGKYNGDIEIRQEIDNDNLYFVLNVMMVS